VTINSNSGRDTRLDIIRGLAMVTIVLNHLTEMVFSISRWGRFWKFPTPFYYGFSSAAELFVMLSGYMVGMVYLSKPDPYRKLGNRAWKIYVTSVVVFVAVLPFSQVGSRAYLRHTGLLKFVSDPSSAVLNMLTLQEAPRLIGVLSLYIVLMIATPLFILILKRSVWMAIGISVVLYLFMQWDGALDLVPLPGTPFHPLAWQLLFFIPMIAGRSRLHIGAFQFIERYPVILPLTALLLLGSAAAKIGSGIGVLPGAPWTARMTIGGVAIGHSVVLLIFYMAALTRAKTWLSHQPFRALATIGSHSLYCFAVSIVATYLAGWLWDVAWPNYVSYLVTCAGLVLVTYATALWLERRKANSKSEPVQTSWFRLPGQAIR
jgi:hypothetical protein